MWLGFLLQYKIYSIVVVSFFVFCHLLLYTRICSMFLCSYYNAITLYAVYMGCVVYLTETKKNCFFFLSVMLGQVVNRHLTNTHKKKKHKIKRNQLVKIVCLGFSYDFRLILLLLCVCMLFYKQKYTCATGASGFKYVHVYVLSCVVCFVLLTRLQAIVSKTQRVQRIESIERNTHCRQMFRKKKKKKKGKLPVKTNTAWHGNAAHFFSLFFCLNCMAITIIIIIISISTVVLPVK